MLRERGRIEPLVAGSWIVALDRSGVQRSSKQIAELVREREERAPQRTAFVLGGPHGLDETLLAEADLTWSIGKLTLPHQLARVVVVEQLYRAFTILRGEPYHR
jgi:23S rRNA (pseudouridine1915-N3)-methyltransferase